ncbi:hypothetical protein AU186_11875 [Mycobacterium sp. GA-1999]|nr:hypothetical protein AU185_12300 [Mycobacterium sp. GA-0227b]KUH81789.1 hypothetical protein AU186_11875 [Mycobacterium sp. GA-1999]
MNSMGTPPMVQKNRSTPGTPVSSMVTSLAKALAFSRVSPKSSVMKDNAASPSGTSARRCSGTSSTSSKPASPPPSIVTPAPSDGGHPSVCSSTSPGTCILNWTVIPTTSVRNAVSV